jgi:CARDB protein
MPLKRLVVAIWMVGLVACGAAAAAPLPRAELHGLICRRAAEPPARVVAITAVMRPMSGTVRMALRFELERRTDRTGSFHTLSGRQLGQWVSPANPTLGQNAADVWMLKQNVVNLPGPAFYRFRVWFRWTGTGGRVLNSAMRVSSSCYQPPPQPDLGVRSIAIKALGNGEDQYTAVIHNGGAAASGAFAVALERAGAAAQRQVSDPLGPGATKPEVFTAPACASGSNVTVVADPGGQLADANRDNNAMTVACSESSGT